MVAKVLFSNGHLELSSNLINDIVFDLLCFIWLLSIIHVVLLIAKLFDL